VLYRESAQIQREELAMCDDSVLAARHLSHPPVTWAISWAYIAHEIAHAGHGGEDGRGRRAGQRLGVAEE
jgi:hypothetical protein